MEGDAPARLILDTPYVSLLRSRRQRIHADIARALEERFADQVETAPAIIVHHYAEAGLPEPAAHSAAVANAGSVPAAPHKGCLRSQGRIGRPRVRHVVDQ
jgi:hypothetical protein